MNLDKVVPDGLAVSRPHNVIHGFVNGAAVIVNPLEQRSVARPNSWPYVRLTATASRYAKAAALGLQKEVSRPMAAGEEESIFRSAYWELS